MARGGEAREGHASERARGSRRAATLSRGPCGRRGLTAVGFGWLTGKAGRRVKLMAGRGIKTKLPPGAGGKGERFDRIRSLDYPVRVIERRRSWIWGFGV